MWWDMTYAMDYMSLNQIFFASLRELIHAFRKTQRPKCFLLDPYFWDHGICRICHGKNFHPFQFLETCIRDKLHPGSKDFEHLFAVMRLRGFYFLSYLAYDYRDFLMKKPIFGESQTKPTEKCCPIIDPSCPISSQSCPITKQLCPTSEWATEQMIRILGDIQFKPLRMYMKNAIGQE